MLTAKECQAKYGNPEKELNMTVCNIPPEYVSGGIPKRVYCNKDMVEPLIRAFKLINQQGLGSCIKTFDGCFNIRNKRGGSTPSLHSWGVAIDINAAWNRFGATPTMEPAVVKCFKDSGFDWGGDWDVPDGMHMQLKRI